MKGLFKKVKREVDDRLRPPSGQSVLNSPARSSRSSQELALAPDHGTSTTPPTEINAIETTIASIQSATPSADLLVPADDPPPSPIVNFESTTLQTASAVEDTHVDLDKLRVAIEEGDTNLFVTLHVALDDLFSAARSQEDYYNVQQELAAVEAGLVAFKAVVGGSSSGDNAFDENELKKQLHAIGVVVLRALTTLGTNAKRFTGDGPLQPEQVIGEIKNLLELLALLLETFEVEDNAGADKRLPPCDQEHVRT